MTPTPPPDPVPSSPPVVVVTERRPGLWARFRWWLLNLRARFRAWLRANLVPFMICGLVFTFLVVYLANRIFIFVNAGEAGVLFHTLTDGTQLDHVYAEGMHIIAPWNQMVIYNMRVQQQSQEVDALSSNGLTIQVTVSMRYYPEYKELPLLHQKVGPAYAEKIVFPEVTTGVREVIGKYKPEDLYTLKTSDISDAINFSVARRVNDKFIVLDAVNVTNIRLPALVTTAIEKKLTQEQVSQEYEFRIASQKQEAERLKYEADGIADYNRIVNASLTPTLLKFKGIDATLALAQSPNAKVVVIGAGNQGLPLILNDATAPLTAPAAPTAPAAAPPSARPGSPVASGPTTAETPATHAAASSSPGSATP